MEGVLADLPSADTCEADAVPSNEETPNASRATNEPIFAISIGSNVTGTMSCQPVTSSRPDQRALIHRIPKEYHSLAVTDSHRGREPGWPWRPYSGPICLSSWSPSSAQLPCQSGPLWTQRLGRPRRSTEQDPTRRHGLSSS